VHIDASFAALPLDELADLALARSTELGATYATFRIERSTTQTLRARDREIASSSNDQDFGLAVQVIVDGTWGFAATTEVSRASAMRTADEAVRTARISRPISSEEVILADEPVHVGEWSSPFDVDPMDVSERSKGELLLDWSARLLDGGADHSEASVMAVKELLFFADSRGTRTRQQRVRVHPSATAYLIGDDGMESMRSIAPPVGRGWEYLTGTGWDWDDELARIPLDLFEKAKAPSIEAGNYDLVIDPSNLWLTIHESIGHATELDRALGYEAAYAGTSFATFDQLGSLQYGSPIMHVTGDRQAEHGLASIGWDHEGVAAQTWDLIRDGVLVGYQLDRRMAQMKGLGRSNGCSYADSPTHIPLQRMANVSLQPAPTGGTTADLIAGVENGLYVVGDKSWSIDMQRFNFQFTGQRFYRIRSGRLDGMVKDVAYTATTTEFWNSMRAVGGPSTYVLGGAFNCGKAQPGQIASVSHGCPSALFTGVRILNTREEGGR